MAIENDFLNDKHIFRGEDKILEFTIFEDDDKTPKDVTGWGLRWVLGLSPSVPTVVLEKTSDPGGGITVVGTFSIDPALNTQRVRVTLADTDTEALAVRYYAHALKRTDDGSETVLSYGKFTLQGAVTV